MTFLSLLADSLLEAKTEGIFRNQNSKVVIRRLAANEAYDWFFEDRLVELIRAKKAGDVYLQSDSGGPGKWLGPDSSGLLVEFKVLDLGIHYLAGGQNGATDSERVQRRGNLSFFLRILDYPSGKVMVSEQVAATRQGWIRLQERATVESTEIVFTRGTVERQVDNNNKTVAALLLTGVSGVVVFLFYSLRSR